jgi:hypothetical protein
MATMFRYQLPMDQTGWSISGETQTSFTWEYEDERSKLLGLYDKGKKQQAAIEFSEVDSEPLLDHDNRVAEDFDAGRFVRESVLPR